MSKKVANPWTPLGEAIQRVIAEQIAELQTEITRLRTPMECGHVGANRGEDGACVVCEQIRGVCAGYTGGCFCDFLGVSECPVHGD